MKEKKLGNPRLCSNKDSVLFCGLDNIAFSPGWHITEHQEAKVNFGSFTSGVAWDKITAVGLCGAVCLGPPFVFPMLSQYIHYPSSNPFMRFERFVIYQWKKKTKATLKPVWIAALKLQPPMLRKISPAPAPRQLQPGPLSFRKKIVEENQ